MLLLDRLVRMRAYKACRERTALPSRFCKELCHKTC